MNQTTEPTHRWADSGTLSVLHTMGDGGRETIKGFVCALPPPRTLCATQRSRTRGAEVWGARVMVGERRARDLGKYDTCSAAKHVVERVVEGIAACEKA